MDLPTFRYHPNPLRSGSIVASSTKCRCCKKSRGFIYTSNVYAEDELDDAVCPWCIANGSAAEKFEATFVDSEALNGDVADAVMDEITQRTPGFDSWQSDYWPVCCADATAFLAPVGLTELRSEFPELEAGVLGHLISELGLREGAAKEMLHALKKDEGPSAYLFRCLHCQKAHFHVDSL